MYIIQCCSLMYLYRLGFRVFFETSLLDFSIQYYARNYFKLATFRDSITLVFGHCISFQLIDTIDLPAKLFAYMTPNSFFAVVK